MVPKGFQPDLGPFGIQHDTDRRMQFGAQRSNAADVLGMPLVSAMRKVQARNVHPRLNHCPQNRVIFRGGA